MTNEWANKDRYNPSHGVPEPCIPQPRGKAVVRSVPASGDVSSRNRGGFWRGWSDRPGGAVRSALPRGGRLDRPS
jgi:hypothetical protein